MKHLKLIALFHTVLLLPITAVSQEQFQHCNALLDHGIYNITTTKSASHAVAYKWHKNCGVDIERSSDSNAFKAEAEIFGYFGGGASSTASQARERVQQWCSANQEFAQSNSKLFEEASAIQKDALESWNQCQAMAKKGINITANPSGTLSTYVNFKIDSTLDADLELYPVVSSGYKCTTYTSSEDNTSRVALSASALVARKSIPITNKNIQIECKRSDPIVAEIKGVNTVTYEEGYISINTSSEAYQYYVPEKPDHYYATPPGSVLAFNLEECPTSWNPFEPAYGRFIRGVDRTGTNIDPEGERSIGSTQEDEIRVHSHTITEWRPEKRGDGKVPAEAQSTSPGGTTTTGNSGDLETRPKNVALLYCIKQ